MKTFILIFSIMIASKIFAEQAEPIAPTVFAPWSTGLRDAEGTPYPGNKGGYALTLENKNGKPIFCRDTTFLATLDEYGNSCGNIVVSTTINFGDAGQTLEILPGTANAYFKADIGNSERIDLEKKSGLVLEFCDRQALMKNFRCGFNCESDNRKFDEKWDETITGGTKKFYCHSTGVKKKTSDPVTCNTGFKASADLMECERIMCPGNIAVGGTRVSTINDDFGRSAGEKREICQASGFYDNPVVSCFEDFRKAGDDRCIHKSTYREYYLSQQASSCNGPGAATSRDCQAAASRWCSFNYGYSTAYIQQLGPNEAGVGCYNGTYELAPKTFTIQRSWGPVNLNILDRRYTQTYCQEIKHMDVGIINEIGVNDVIISCLKQDGQIYITAEEAKKFHSACVPKQELSLDTISMACRAAASNACRQAGYGTGIVKSTDVGLEAACFRTGTYKGAPFLMN